MSDIKTIGQIAYKRPVAQLSMEELAARQRTLIRQSGGIEFARGADREEKRAVRQHALDLFTPDRWPRYLHMLTLPGLQWRFERLLLASREAGWFRHIGPGRTYFTSCENDRAIYTAAVSQMPGLHTPDSELKRIRYYPFAEHGVKTRYASLFFANVDDFMAYDWEHDSRQHARWGAAWFDYTGPLDSKRLKLIRDFFHRSIGAILIITAPRVRWTQQTSADVEHAGSHSKWVRSYFDDAEVLHELEYHDGMPMMQFAVRHRTPLWAWE